MSYSKIILQDSADIVWPLDDISQSSSISKPINFYNNNPFSYSASIVPGNTDVQDIPIIFGGGTALRFTASSVGMSIPGLNRFSEVYSNKNSCMSFWFQTEFLSDTEYPIFKKRNFDNIGLFIKSNYLIFKYGTSASYAEVVADIVNPNEPTHIIINKTPSSLSLIVNGTLYTQSSNNIVTLPEDPSSADNNYFDFYGPPSETWIIDSIAIYPNSLSPIDAKRHYVYGLGKSFGDDIFHSLGGSIYNFSTIDTEKIFKINMQYPQEWYFAELTDLDHDTTGIRPLTYREPIFYSYDSDIITASNQISFRNLSGSTTTAAYIDIVNLYEKINYGDHPFFVKVKFDGQLPKEYEKQRIMSYGIQPGNEFITFNLYNDASTYKILVETITSSSVSFDIADIQNSPEVFIGMKFDRNSYFYFSQSGSSVQTKTLNIYDQNGYGLDPLSLYFPPVNDSILRIGSRISYDRTNFSTQIQSINQFSGAFKSFSVLQKDFTASFTFNDINSYRRNKYRIEFDSNKNRFKTSTYGYGTFNLHAIDLGEFIIDTDQRLSGNIIDIGYPDIQSSSQVLFYVTHLEYSGSVVHPKTKLNSIDYLPFINNKNISSTYLQFDFEIYADDSNYYPPKIKYFAMETYKGDSEKVTIRDDAATNYKLYNSSSYVYLPEIRPTPNIFITKNSGIPVINSIAEFIEDFSPKPLDLRTLDNLILWLDSRFTSGFNKINPPDDSHIFEWSDLSGSNNSIYDSVVDDEPLFRIQSKNVLKVNQSNGSENGDLSDIIAINSSIESSPDGAIEGSRGIKIIPDGTGINSYINVLSNNGPITLYPNQKYIFVGSIKLSKPQTASVLHELSRGIGIFTNDGVSTTLSASSAIAPNSPGIYSLSVTFTTASNVVSGEARLYNGSFLDSDFVYWDKIGLYPTTSSYISWSPPLTEDDRHSLMFNGNEMFTASISLSNSFSLYAFVRSFGNGKILSNSENILYVESGSYTFSTGTPYHFYENDGEFHAISVISNNGSSSVYLDKNFIGAANTGTNSLTIREVGDQFKGDICSIVLYDEVHGEYYRSLIEDWMEESFK